MDSSTKSCASLAIYDPATSSWRTSQRSLFEGWTPFSGRFPKHGMMQSGRVSERPMSARRTGASASSSWPTVRATEWKGCGPKGSKSQKHMLKRQYLAATVCEMNWPTPNAPNGGRAIPKDATIRGQTTLTAYTKNGKKCQVDLNYAAKNSGPSATAPPSTTGSRRGSLNPDWVETLMGLPIGFTGLEPLEMESSFPNWLRLCLNCLEQYLETIR